MYSLSLFLLACWSAFRVLGGSFWGNLWPAVGWQRGTGGRLPRQVPRRGRCCKESAGHQRNWDQTPPQTQAPQHYHVQVRKLMISYRVTFHLVAWIPLLYLSLSVHLCLVIWLPCFLPGACAPRLLVTVSWWNTVPRANCMRCWGRAVKSPPPSWLNGPWASQVAWTTSTSTKSSIGTSSPPSKSNDTTQPP